MTAKQLSEQIPGLREILEGMELLSAPGHRTLRERPMLIDECYIRERLDNVEQLVIFLKKDDKKIEAARINALLKSVKDIASTVKRLDEGGVPDEVELFEVKSLSIIAGELRTLLKRSDITAVEIPVLTSVYEILDPDGNGTPHFHIFNSYDSRLPEIRKALREADPESEEITRLYAEQRNVEDEVRTRLSVRLRPYACDLRLALEAIAELDILEAAAHYAISYELSRPVLISSGDTIFKGLFNLAVKTMLEKRGGSYQPVDISFGSGVTLITGANMGGKTITLKSIAIAQALAQLGFFVPAEEAAIVPVSEIRLCIGDSQSEQAGLSSFASEMMNLHEALQDMKQGKRMLLLVDEPARTTNPEEGRALAAAFIDIFGRYESRTIMTSHYSGLRASRHWRVKGLSGIKNTVPLSPSAITGLMDYRLVAESGAIPPHEALRIATLLGVDADIISAAGRFLNNNNFQ